MANLDEANNNCSVASGIWSLVTLIKGRFCHTCAILDVDYSSASLLEADMHLFPDTHFFLHFKHAHEIPWGEVTSDPEINLVVGRAVNKELDRKKFEMRGRPQDRARYYVSKLGAVAGNEDPGILRAREPKIVLHLMSGRPIDWVAPAELDPTWGDDVLLADVLAFKHAHTDADVRVLTGDPGLKAKTIAHGLKVISLSDKPGWELPDEKTSEQKEVEKLRRENEDLKRVGPLIECTLEIEGHGTERIEVSITRYPPLSNEVVGELLADLRQRYPKTVEFPDPFLTGPEGARLFNLASDPESVEQRAPTQAEIDVYHKCYDTWIMEAETLVRGAHERLETSAAFVDCTIALSNIGNNSAEGVRLNIESVGDFALSEAPDENTSQQTPKQESSAKLGKPPVPPTWKKVPKPVALAGVAKLPPGYEQALSIAAGKLPNNASAMLAALGGEMPGSMGGAFTAITSAAHAAGLNEIGSTAATLAGHDRLYGLLGASSLEDRYGLNSAIFKDQQAYGNVVPSSMFETTLDFPGPLPARDRDVFYRVAHPDLLTGATSGVAYECEEFRHKVGAVRFELCVSSDPDEPRVGEGAVRVSLWAANLRRPFEKTFPVRFIVGNGDVRAVAIGLLP